jgi:hypothetical protein
MPWSLERRTSLKAHLIRLEFTSELLRLGHGSERWHFNFVFIRCSIGRVFSIIKLACQSSPLLYRPSPFPYSLPRALRLGFVPQVMRSECNSGKGPLS